MSNDKKLFFTAILLGIGLTTFLFTNCAPPGFKLNTALSNSFSSLGIEDPLLPHAWHIHNTGQKVFATTGGLAGADVNVLGTWRQGVFGEGVKILISDDGVEDNHEDLKDNFLYSATGSKDYTKPAPYVSTTGPALGENDNHGTSVAGLIAATGWNGRGSLGLAPKVAILSANFLSSQATATRGTLLDQATGDFDISNMSWGAPHNVLFSRDIDYESILRNRVDTGRSGKGVIFVKAAGNHQYVLCRNSLTNYCVGNANFDGHNSNPYQIVVGALNASGVGADYSSPGSNLWISSFGGDFGELAPAMLTTDRMGCDKGVASTKNSSSIPFQKGQNGNTNCNYTSVFNGTSSAAPLVSAAAALMLSVNPELTWRDVRFILAKTARVVGSLSAPSRPHLLNSPVPNGYTWELPWVTNRAGFHFHNRYGFGSLDVDAAVAMARSYSSTLGTYSESMWAHENTNAMTIPDNSSTGASSLINFNTNMKIEGVQVQLWINHADISELAVELISPQGTRSILVHMRNSLEGFPNYEGEVLLTNAFYQESAAGSWRLNVIDGKAGTTGSLTRWRLNISGSAP